MWSAFLPSARTACHGLRNAPRDDGLLRARYDPHQTNEGESHHPPSTSGRNKSGACEFIFQARRVMRVYSGHRLDYDPVALVILVVGIGAVVLLALSI